MKVILKKELDNLGVRGDVVNVRDGYARNFLIPQGLVMRWSEGAHKVLAQEKRVYQLKVTEEVGQAEALAEKINAVSVTISKRVAENEALYGSVTATDILVALEGAGFKMERNRLMLEKPIKALGEYKIRVHLHPKVDAHITVNVAAQE